MVLARGNFQSRLDEDRKGRIQKLEKEMCRTCGETWIRWWHFHPANRNPSQRAAFSTFRVCTLLADHGLPPSSTTIGAERHRASAGFGCREPAGVSFRWHDGIGDTEGAGALGDQGHAGCDLMTQQGPNAFVGIGNWKQKCHKQQSGVTAQH